MAKEVAVKTSDNSVILICKEKCARFPKLELKFEGGKQIVTKKKFDSLQKNPDFMRYFGIGKLIGVYGEVGFTAKDTSTPNVISLGDNDVPPTPEPTDEP